ncbi:MAG: type II toxin-antitoxin system VapC family toxin [Nitrospinae bacterium]|nr:type II toxin-antitoxin system VapC family toxin [Nitrospinota bacterium]
MGIGAKIKGGKVYLDANIFIYLLEGHPNHQKVIGELFRIIDAGGLAAFTSELTLMETLVKPMMDNNEALANLYMGALETSDSLHIEKIGRDILIEAARLRAQSPRLLLPDAIHAATALALKCGALITNDKKLRPISGIDVVLISEASDEMDETVALQP